MACAGRDGPPPLLQPNATDKWAPVIGIVARTLKKTLRALTVKNLAFTVYGAAGQNVAAGDFCT